MDRWRAGHRSHSAAVSSSPAPAHHRSASVGGLPAVNRAQNGAAKAAAARLAHVMASQPADEDEDDLPAAAGGGGGGGGFRSGAPRPAASGNAAASPAMFGRNSSRSSLPSLGRLFSEHTPAVRSTSAGRPAVAVRSTPLMPPSRTSTRILSPLPPIEPSPDRRRENRVPVVVGHLNSRDTGNQRVASALQDELDMLQEENENILEKLRFAEEKCEEAEAKARELEKQVAALGEGVTLEARLLSRKEAALRQREAALVAAAHRKDGRDEEITSLRQEAECAKDEVATAIEQLSEAASEAKDLRTFTQRMILTKEEREEVVLKRCWLAHYWGLAVRHGIYPEIATSKYEHWSSLAPLPLEVVLSAGQKAKEIFWDQGDDDDSKKRTILLSDLSDITGEDRIESMLSVEKGLRELASLKVEDAVAFALAHHRRPNIIRLSTSDLKSHGDPKFMDSFELNKEESGDVLFKQAWLTYLWRRAKAHGVEEDIAEERLQFWISRTGPLTSHDAVDVERGLTESRKLGIEQQLWEASRREIEQASMDSNHKDADM